MGYAKSIVGSLAVLAAVGVGVPNIATADSLIVDAKGKTIGSMFEFSLGGKGYPEVIRRMTPDVVVRFAVSKYGLVPNDQLWRSYISSDCTGPAYMTDETDLLVRTAYFVQSGGADGNDFTKGSLFYAASSIVQVPVSSVQTSTFGTCRTLTPELRQVHPAIAVDVTAWRVIAPFKVK